MFYIVEKESKLENLQRLSKLGFYVEVISSNDNYHPKLTSTVAVYIRPLKSKRGFIIPINHDEGINVDKDRVLQLLLSCKELYTLDKKELLYHFHLQSAIDVSLLYSMKDYDRIEISDNVSIINYYYNMYSNFKNINNQETYYNIIQNKTDEEIDNIKFKECRSSGSCDIKSIQNFIYGG